MLIRSTLMGGDLSPEQRTIVRLREVLMEVMKMEPVPQAAARYVGDPDLPLVEASICGDISAFETLVRRYSPWLLRIAQQVTHNWDDAEEAVQETFLKAHQNLRQFQGYSKFSTWLIRIAMNRSLLVLGKRRSWAVREISLESKDSRGNNVPLQVSDWHPDPERLYQQTELRQILRTGLLRLRPTLRVVFVLRDIEGLSVAETATILNLAPGAVKVRLHRARLELRDILTRYFRKTDAGPTMYPETSVPLVLAHQARE